MMAWIEFRWILFVVSLVFQSTTTVLPLHADEAARDSQVPLNAEEKMYHYSPVTFQAQSGLLLPYQLYDAGQQHPNDALPLLVFLHGAGERGVDNQKQLKHGAKNFVTQAFQKKNPCYVVAPQCREDHLWCNVPWTVESVQQPNEPSEELMAVFELIDQLIASKAINKNRIYITGLSMGGFGTWDAITRRPDFFAAAIPICGGGDVSHASKLTKLPIWCFHGDSDTVVQVDLSRRMINAIKDVGGTPKYTEYPGVAHDSWTATYDNPELYQWLFNQSK